MNEAAPRRPQAAETTPPIAPPAVLSAIERELTRYVGPVAEMLVRRAARHQPNIEALVHTLLPSIESERDREAFARSCARATAARKAPLAPASAPAPAPVRAAVPALTPSAGPTEAGSPLLRAADALLEVLPRLRAATDAGEAAALQARLREHLAHFEAEARARGASPAHTGAAHGLLRSFVDEVIASTPWAAPCGSACADPFELLQGLLEDPLAQAPLIELFYVCLALGFEGRYRNTAHARTLLDALAARLRELLPTRRAHGAGPRTLSPHWRGHATRGPNDLARLPLWVVATLGAVALLALWLALNARLDARARPVFARIATAPAALHGATAPATGRPRLAAALQAEAAAGQLEVRDEAQRSLITLPADSLFAAGHARLGPRAGELLARVAQALRGPRGDIVGEVAVIGHGDDAPPTSLQFPSNWHFTRARAQAVADALAALRVPAARAEGRAEFEPRAPNRTPDERAKNRRIEIELRLPRPEELAS